MTDELDRDCIKLAPVLAGYIAWRSFGHSATCTTVDNGGPCLARGHTCVVFLGSDGELAMTTLCEEHAQRTINVLDALGVEERP